MQEVSTTGSPRVEGSIPVKGNFFAVIICSYTILADLTEWSIYRKSRMHFKFHYFTGFIPLSPLGKWNKQVWSLVRLNYSGLLSCNRFLSVPYVFICGKKINFTEEKQSIAFSRNDDSARFAHCIPLPNVINLCTGVAQWSFTDSDTLFFFIKISDELP